MQILSFLHDDIASQVPAGVFDGAVALVTPSEVRKVSRHLFLGADPADNNAMTIAQAMRGKENTRCILLDAEGTWRDEQSSERPGWTDEEIATLVTGFAAAYHPIPVGVYRIKHKIPADARIVNPDWYPKLPNDQWGEDNGLRQWRAEWQRASAYAPVCQVVPATSPDITERGKPPAPAPESEIERLCWMIREANPKSIAVWARRDSDPDRLVSFVERLRSA